MIKFSKRFPHTHERGQSLTELAIVMSFLLVLLAGVVDIGRAFFTYIAMRDAAQEGAIYGSYICLELEEIDGKKDWCKAPAAESNICSEIQSRIRTTSDMITDLYDAGAISVQCSLNYCAGEQVEVTVTYDGFPLTMPFIGTMVGSQTVDISASIIDTVLTDAYDAGCP